MQKKVSFENLIGLEKKSTGLCESEFRNQLSKFGANQIIESEGNKWVELFYDTIKDPMVWFLIGVAIIFYFIGDYKEAIVLLIATVPLIFMDAFLHWRTLNSTVALKRQLSSKSIVIREGNQQEIDSLEIVPGDLVVLSDNNIYLPADGHWEKTDSLQVDESALTGEAFPIGKSAIEFNPFEHTGEVLLDSRFLGFAGTRVLTGGGLLRVLSTGKKTSYGEIVHSVIEVTHERTPLQNAILDLTRVLIYIAVVFCILLAAIRIYQGHGFIDALLSAAVLAVAAIPEEFPVVFTFFFRCWGLSFGKTSCFGKKSCLC